MQKGLFMTTFDKNKYFSTGEFARLTNVTKNTLFHYDQIGLFSPEIRLANDYRYYSIQQMESMQVIQMLRELGMPLSDIREYLNGNSPTDLIELYDKELAQISDKIRMLKQKESWLKEQRERARMVSTLDLGRIYIRSLPKRYYYFAHSSGNDEKSLSKKAGSLIAKYDQLCQPMGYQLVYLQQRVDLCRHVYDNYHDILLLFSHRPHSGSCKTLPAGDYVTAYHKGHWNTIGSSYERLFDYIRREKLHTSDTFFETEIIDRLYTKSYEDYVTELSVPLL